MDRYFTPAFFKFLLAFVAIIGIAFGILYFVTATEAPAPVDSVANPA